MKIIGVDGRLYTRERLDDAIAAAKETSAPITLLYAVDEDIRTAKVEYHGGERYPHLTRDESKPDYLDDLIKAHWTGQ
jgi:nucleotide-binding universal stress UspA family protein